MESATQDAEFTGAGATGPSQRDSDSDEGAVLGRIEIPRLGIAAIVAEGVDSRTLGRAVGHVPFSAQPGKQGNCALAGHRDTFMRGLGGVRVNDVILIVTLGGTHTYRVEWSEVVEPERVDVLDATAASSLTLVTCYPFAFVGRAPQRFVVRAQMVTPDAERGVVSAGPAAGVATLSTQGRLK
jgi:sortase A